MTSQAHSMWPILIAGAATLVVAARYLKTATAARRSGIETLTRATRYLVIGGVASNITAVCWHTTTRDEIANSPDFHKIVIYGVGEALTPAVLGFTMLGLAWLMVAVGTRRATDVID